MQLDLGYIDLTMPKGVPGRLTWYRNSRQKGRAFLTNALQPAPVTSAPVSFVRALDQVADAHSIERVYLRTENSWELIVDRRTWWIKYGGVGEVCAGRISGDVDAPHQLVSSGLSALETASLWELHTRENVDVRLQPGSDLARGYRISEWEFMTASPF